MKFSRCSAPAVVAVVVALLMFGSSTLLPAQGMLHEGQHFLAGFIHPERAPGEPLTKDAYRIIVASRFATRALVAGKEVSIQPNTSVEVVIDSCDVAIVTSDKPITVATRILMQGNGEQAMQIPTYAWGLRYFSFTWWTDRYGLDTKHYAFAKRLVIAREDNTLVSISGKSGPLQIMLNSGEWSYVPGYLDTTSFRNSASDMTGESFNATKPIMVISGHGKTAVLEHPDALPASGPYARAANRSRGTLMESMIPVEHAGTSFITVPFQYSPTRKRGQDNSSVGIGDDRGDVIRFIATTTQAVLSYKTDTGDLVVDTLSVGEVYTARTVETVRQWNATSPVLCAQYGKSYGHITSQATQPEDDPSTDAGLPMLVSIPSTNQWTSHAMFTCPQDLINYVQVVCRTEHTYSMFFDGKQIAALTAPIKTVDGKFTCMRLLVSPGSHQITTTSKDATFMTVTYGNLDGLQLCNAYASTTGVALRSACADSIQVSIDRNIDSADVTFNVVALTSCDDVGLAMLYASDFMNCDISVVGNMAHIVRKGSTDSAYAVFTCISRLGTTLSRRISFEAATSVAPADIRPDRLAAHPIPAIELLHVTWQATSTASRYMKLTDIFGYSYQLNVEGEHASVDVRGLAPGLYLLSTSSTSIPVLIAR
jgi:hypothetical protein